MLRSVNENLCILVMINCTAFEIEIGFQVRINNIASIYMCTYANCTDIIVTVQEQIGHNVLELLLQV